MLELRIWLHLPKFLFFIFSKIISCLHRSPTAKIYFYLFQQFINKSVSVPMIGMLSWKRRHFSNVHHFKDDEILRITHFSQLWLSFHNCVICNNNYYCYCYYLSNLLAWSKLHKAHKSVCGLLKKVCMCILLKAKSRVHIAPVVIQCDSRSSLSLAARQGNLVLYLIPLL